MNLLKLTKVLFCVMVARSMIPQFVVGIHPIAFIIEIFKTNHSIVELPCTIFKGGLISEVIQLNFRYSEKATKFRKNIPFH